MDDTKVVISDPNPNYVQVDTDSYITVDGLLMWLDQLESVGQGLLVMDKATGKKFEIWGRD